MFYPGYFQPCLPLSTLLELLKVRKLFLLLIKYSGVIQFFTSLFVNHYVSAQEYVCICFLFLVKQIYMNLQSIFSPVLIVSFKAAIRYSYLVHFLLSQPVVWKQSWICASSLHLGTSADSGTQIRDHMLDNAKVMEKVNHLIFVA